MMNLDGFYNKRICVAVSGGVDSVTLLHYLRERADKYRFALSAVHIEHGIRGDESVRDMRFVQSLCQEWGVELFLSRANCLELAKTQKQSLETVARAVRYRFFETLFSENKTDYIALAHHQNDEAETVLFRLARGSSLTGLRGMATQNGRFLRPFLDWKKSEIIEYAQEHNLAFCQDATNFEPCATRNKIRLTVLPALEDAVCGATENIARFASFASEDDEYLYAQSQALISQESEDKFVLSFCEVAPLFRRACLTALKKLGVEKDYTALHLQSVYALQKAERGAYLCLPKGVIAKKDLDGIALFVEKEKTVLPCEKPTIEPFSESGFDGGRYAVSVFCGDKTDIQTDWKVLRLDMDELPQDACFRFRREGDEIKAFGGATKSLKKLFNEKKIPVQEREWLPLIAQKDGNKVFAVCGVEIADEVKVTENTARAVCVAVVKK